MADRYIYVDRFVINRVRSKEPTDPTTMLDGSVFQRQSNPSQVQPAVGTSSRYSRSTPSTCSPLRDCPLVVCTCKYPPGRHVTQMLGEPGGSMGPARFHRATLGQGRTSGAQSNLQTRSKASHLLLCFAHQNIHIQLRTLWRCAQRPAPTPRAPPSPSLTGTLTQAITAQTFQPALVQPAIPPPRHTAAAPSASQIC